MEPIKFRIAKIETLQFAMLPDFYDLSSDNFDYSFDLNFAFPGVEQKIIACSCLVKYEGKSSPFLILEVGMLFEIENDSWERIIGKNQFILPKETAYHMMSLMVGAVRGILHSETKNTDFNRLILPSINLTKDIDRDIVQPFDKKTTK
jgi:hypothetical protein